VRDYVPVISLGLRTDKRDLYSNEDYCSCTDIANILLQYSPAQDPVNVKK
jgi:hypothetical protein